MATVSVNKAEHAKTEYVDEIDVVEETECCEEKKEKKSHWREIEHLKQKLMLLKALKEIDPEFDPYSSEDYMEF